MRGLLERISTLAARLTAGLVAAMAIAMMLSLLTQVFFRYVVGTSLTWPGELAMLLFTWTMLLAASLGVREGFHVRLEVLRNLLPELLRKPLERLTLLLIALFGGLLTIVGADYVEQTIGQTSAAIRYPIELLHLSAPACGVLIVLHAVTRLLRADPEATPARDREEHP